MSGTFSVRKFAKHVLSILFIVGAPPVQPKKKYAGYQQEIKMSDRALVLTILTLSDAVLKVERSIAGKLLK